MHKLDRHFPFSCFLAEASLLLPVMKQKSSSGGRVQKGQGKMQICSLAWLSPVPPTPRIPPFLCSWQLLPTLLCCFFVLNQCVHEAHQGLASSYRCKISAFHTQGDPGRPQQGRPGVTFALEPSHPASCPKISTLSTRTTRSRRGCWPLRVGRKIQQ